jgi:Xaa-Pro aminopeptidase
MGAHATVPLSAAGILRDGPPVLLERAREVLEREKLDAIVVQLPVNAYYLTGWWPVTSRMSGVPGLIAILTRRQDDPIGVVCADFTYYYLLSDQHPSFPLEVFLHSGPVDPSALAPARDGGYRVEPRADAPRIFEDGGRMPMSARERTRASAVAAAQSRHSLSAAQDFALVKAMRAFGLERGRVGIDDESLRATLIRALPSLEFASAELALQRMRVVKSPRELALQRVAAQANADAAIEAAMAVRAGATLREMRLAFQAGAARRGNRPVFLVLDGVASEGVDETLRDGAAFLFDAVSEGAGYHGDFARTVFVGEPARSMRDVTKAIQLGWEDVRDALRPGLRFSEITALGRATVKKAGYDFLIAFGPHSVGLYHQDAAGLGDLVLEPGMVVSVDCPLMQSGFGGTAHLEDLTLITPAGSEPIHRVTEAIVVV